MSNSQGHVCSGKTHNQVISSVYHDTYALQLKFGYIVVNNTGEGHVLPFFDKCWKNIIFYQRVFVTENYKGQMQIFNYNYQNVVPGFWSNVLVDEHCVVVENMDGNIFLYDYEGNLM